MRKILTLLLVLATVTGYSQIQNLGNPKNTVKVQGGLTVDSLVKLIRTAQIKTADTTTFKLLVIDVDGNLSGFQYWPKWGSEAVGKDTIYSVDPVRIDTIGGKSYILVRKTFLDSIRAGQFGGGGSGITPNQLGFVPTKTFVPTSPLLYDTSWAATTSNNYVVSGATAAVVTGKVQITGSGNNYTQQYYKNQLSYLEHWKKEDTLTIVSTPSSTTYGIASAITLAGATTQSNYGFVDLSTGANAGKAYIITAGATVSATSASVITFTTGDTIVMKFEQGRDTLTFTVTNKNNTSTTTVQYIMSTALTYPNVISHTSGVYGFAVKGGTYRITGTRVTNLELVNRPLAIAGDSKFMGYYAGSWSARFGEKLGALMLGASSDICVKLIQRIGDIAALAPKQIIIGIGSNNLRSSETLAQTITAYKEVVGRLNGLGIKVYHICLPEGYQGGGGMALANKIAQLDSFIRATYPQEYIDVFTTVNGMRSTLLTADSVHITAAGNDTVYQIITRSGLVSTPTYDNTIQKNIYAGIGTENVQTNLSLLRNGGNTSTGADVSVGTTSNVPVSIVSSGRIVSRWYGTGNLVFNSLNYSGGENMRGIGDSLGNVGMGFGVGTGLGTGAVRNVFYGHTVNGFTGGSSDNTIVGAYSFSGVSGLKSDCIGIGAFSGYWENRSGKINFGKANNKAPLFHADNYNNKIIFNPPYVPSTRSELSNGAIAEFWSDSLGILFPRLTSSQRDAIASPPVSLFIYNTTLDSFQYYKAGWKTLGGGAGGSGISIGQLTDSFNVRATGYLPVNNPTATGTLTSPILSINGTGGNGYVNLLSQLSTPSAPTSGSMKFYADANGRLAWLTSLGFQRSFRSYTLTANRVYNFQDKDYTLADSADVAGKLLASDSSHYAHKDYNITETITGAKTLSGSLNLSSTSTAFLTNRGTNTQMYAIASPVDGMQWYSTDDHALYVYNADWGWESNDLIHKKKSGIDYLNDFYSIVFSDGFFTAGGTTFPVSGIGTAARPGVLTLGTAASATGRSTLFQANSNQTSIVLGGGRLVFEIAVKIPVLSSATETFSFNAGTIRDASVVTTTNGVYFTYDSAGVGTGAAASGKWQVATTSGGVRSFTTTSVQVVANQWYTLKAVINAAASQVDFYIDNTLVKTETTNIPTVNTIGNLINLMKSAGTTARTVDIDYYYFKQKLTTPR